MRHTPLRRPTNLKKRIESFGLTIDGANIPCDRISKRELKDFHVFLAFGVYYYAANLKKRIKRRTFIERTNYAILRLNSKRELKVGIFASMLPRAYTMYESQKEN